MSQWYKVTGKQHAQIKFRKDVMSRVLKYVFGSSTETHVEIADSEKGWLDKVAQDFGLLLTDVLQPQISTAKCGALTTAQVNHTRTCNKCRQLNQKKTEVKVIAKIAPNQDFTLDGLISSLSVTRDQMMDEAAKLDSLIKNMTEYRNSSEKAKQLITEAEERKHALKLLVEEGRL